MTVHFAQLFDLVQGIFKHDSTDIRVRVVAGSAAGRGVPSNEIVFRDADQPTEVESPMLAFEETTGGYEARLWWTASNFDGAASPRYIWELERTDEEPPESVADGTVETATAPAEGSPVTVELNSAEFGHVYALKVRPSSSAGNNRSAKTEAIFVLGDKGVPQGVAAALGSDGLAVSWSQPVNADNVDITGYEIRYKLTSAAADEVASWTTVPVTVDATTVTHTISGLGNGDHYNVQVRTVIEWESGTYEGEWSDADADPPVTADNPYIVDGGVQVTSTRQSAVDTYGVNNIIEFTVTFSEDVAVTGDPVFEFCLGAATEACTDTNALREAEYSSTESSGADVVFTYTVAGDEDSNGTADDIDEDGISPSPTPSSLTTTSAPPTRSPAPPPPPPPT